MAGSLTVKFQQLEMSRENCGSPGFIVLHWSYEGPGLLVDRNPNNSSLLLSQAQHFPQSRGKSGSPGPVPQDLPPKMRRHHSQSMQGILSPSRNIHDLLKARCCHFGHAPASVHLLSPARVLLMQDREEGTCCF